MAPVDEFDVVIVGSGPVGSTFARELHDAEGALRILLVDGGPQVASPPGRHVRTIVDDVQRSLAQVRSQGPNQTPYDSVLTAGGDETRPDTVKPRAGLYLLGEGAVAEGEDGMPAAAMSSNVGGMGSHWSCACPTPGAGEVIEFLAPELHDELFERARTLLSVTSDAFKDAPLGEEIRSLLASKYDEGRRPERRVQPMPLAIRLEGESRYWAGPDVVLGPLANGISGEFELRPNTIARSITMANGRATGVDLYGAQSGESYHVKARAVVVAADALRTPQLLFASKIAPAALGRYLNDQPQVISLVRLSDRFIPDNLTSAPHRPGGQIEQFSGVSWIPYSEPEFPYHGQIVQMDASPIPLEHDEEVWPGSLVGIGLFGCKDLQRSDRVEVRTSETDAFGLPAIKIHYTFTERDKATFERMKAEARSMAALIGEPVGDTEPVLLPAGSSLHYQGSVRMGAADDGESVCSPEGRVWGTENVFVGGNGVIPTATACNPTLTSVALAVHSARFVAAQLANGGL